MSRNVDLTVLETAIAELSGDAALLALAAESFRDGKLEAKVLQSKEVTALLHAIHRMSQAAFTVSEAFYGPA